MQTRAPKVDPTQAAGEGGLPPGPVRDGAPYDSLQDLSDGHVKITGGLGNMAEWTGPKSVRQLRESQTGAEKGGFQLGVTQITQDIQTLSDLGYPSLQHFLAEGWGTNRAAKETEATTCDRDVRWQSGLGGVTLVGDVEEGLATIEVESKGRTLPLHNL